ncbi:two-partner secretion domain-containing protein, partial [Sphingomonas pituitosa]|uniref:two-partner secretion domain-containing protein n=1 Tax=Sphingomonas pituitosa TaxID=99597 RepID=UPI00083499A2
MKTIVTRNAPVCARRGALRTLILAALATSALSPARAQTNAPVATPPLQPANSRTGLDVTPGGTPIVNIATPDASGTSYNVFTRLSVGKEGLIFANSPTTGNSAIGGFLIANSNLKDGRTASLILNEVTGGVRTTLAGPMEIFGQRAALVIANPTGITCDGCGFINTSRVSLAAATLRFGADGAFSGFRIAEGGDVTVEGKGLLGGNVDYFDIIAAATHLNASLYARDLFIAGGAGSVDYATRTATAEDKATRTGLAIDSSILGGMYANRIRLVGTGAGLGINLQGTVAALEGALTITSDGAIALAGATASGDADITAGQGAVTLGDRVYAGGALAITAQAIRQRGGFAGALGDVSMHAKDDIAFEGGDGLYAGLDGNGALTGAGAVSIVAGGVVDAGGTTLAAGGTVGVDALAMRQGAAGRVGGTKVSIRTRADQVLAGTITASGDAQLAGDAIRLTGTIGANGSLALSGRQLVVAGTATGLGAATVNGSERVSLLSSGALQTNGAVNLVAPTLDIEGAVLGRTGVSIQAAGLTATGQVQTGGDLGVTTSGDAVLGGTWSANGDAMLRIAGNAAVTGGVTAARAVVVQAGLLSVSGAVQAGGSLTLATAGDLATQDNAKILANGTLALTAGRAVSLAGQIGANDALSIRATGVLDAGNAVIATTQALRLDGASLRQGSGGQIGGAQVSLNSVGGQILGGTIGASGDAVVQGDAVALSGTLSANGALTLSGRQLLLSGSATGLGSVTANASEALSIDAAGALQSNGNATIAAPTLAIDGALLGGGGVSLLATTLSNSGSIQSGAGLTAMVRGNAVLGGTFIVRGDSLVAVAGDAALAGRFVTGNTLNVQAARLTVEGDVQAGAMLSLLAAGDLSTAGTAKILASGTIGLTSGGAMALGGQIGSNETLSVRAAGAIDAGNAVLAAAGALGLDGLSVRQGNAGQIAGASVRIGAVAGQQLAGAISASRNATLVGDTIELSGTLTAKEALTLSGRAVDLAGTGWVQSGGDLDLTATGTATLGGTLSAAKTMTVQADGLSFFGTAAADGALSMAAAGKLTTGGNARILADGITSLSGGSVVLAGQLGSNDALTIRAAGLLDTGSATLASTGALRLEAMSLHQAQGGDIAGGSVTLITQAGQLLAGTLRSSGDATLQGDIVSLSGTLGANGALALSGRQLVLGGTATGLASASASGSGGLSILHGGTLQSNGLASLRAPTLELAGTVLGGSGVTIDGAALNSNGSVQAGGALGVTVSGDVLLAGSMAANGDVTLAAGGTATLSGALASAKKASVQAGGIVVGGAVQAGDTLTLHAAGDLTATADAQMAAIGSLALTAAGSVSLAGNSATNDALRVRGRDVTVAGTIQSLRGLSLDAETLHLSGKALTGADGIASVTGAADVSGILSAANDLTLTASTLSTGTSAQLVAGKALTLGTSGTFTHRGALDAGSVTITAEVLSSSGSMVASRDILLSAQTGIAQSGVVQAGGDLSLAAASITLSGSTIGAVGGVAGTGVTIHAPALVFGAGSDIQSGGRLDIAGTQDFTTQGRIVALGDARIASEGALIQNARASSNGVFVLRAGTTLDQAGTLAALGSASLTGQAILNSGSVSSNADLVLDARSTLVSTGALQAGDALRLAAPSLRLAGTTATNRVLHIAGAVVTLDGKTTGLQGIDAQIGALTLGASGALQSGATFRLDVATLDNAGLVASNDAVALATTGGLTNSGQIVAGGALGLRTGQDLVSTGLLQSGAAFDLRSGAAASLGGTVYAGGTASLDVVTLQSDAAQSFQDSLTVTASGYARFGAGSSSYTKGGLTLSAATLTALGAIQSDASLSLTTSQSLTLGGRIQASGTTGIDAGSGAELSGTLVSGGALHVTAPSVSIAGQILANDAVVIAANADNLTLAGTIQAVKDVTLTAVARLRIGAAEESGTGSAAGAGTPGGGSTGGGGSSTVPSSGGGSGTTPDATGTAPVALALDLPSLAGTMAPGSLAASGAVTMSAADIEIAGAVAAKGDLTALATHVLTVRGSAWSEGALLVGSGGLDVGALASLAAAGPVLITAQNDIANLGTIASNGGGLTLRAAGMLSSGGTLSARTDLRVQLGADLVSSGTISADTATIAARDLSLNGTVVGVNGLTLGGRSITLGGGSDLQSGGALALTSSGATMLAGKLLATGALAADAGTSLTIAAGADIQSGGGLGLTAAGEFTSASGSRIAAVGAVRLKANMLALGGTLAGNAGLDVTVMDGLSLSGIATALGDITATAGTTTLSGVLASGGRLTLNGGATMLAATSTVQAGDVLSLSATNLSGSGSIRAAKGLAIAGTGDLQLAGTLAAGTVDGQGQLLQAGDLTVTAGGTLDLAGSASATGTTRLGGQGLALRGTLAGLGDLSLESDSLVTTGAVQANGTITATIRGDATLGGALTGLAGLSLSSGGTLVQNAALASNAGLRLSASGALYHGGTSDAVGDAELAGASLSLGGAIRGNGALSLISTSGDITLAQGALASARTAALQAAGRATLAGTLAGSTSLTIRTAGALTVTGNGVVQAGASTAGGQVTSTGTLVLSAGGSLANAGALGSTGSLAATAQTLSSTGTISAGGTVDLTGGSTTIDGSVAGLDTVSIRATGGTLDLNGAVEGRNVGVSASGGDLTLAAGAVLTAYGTGNNGTLAVASSGSVDLRGRLSANNDLALDAGGSLTIGGDSAGPAVSTLGSATLRVGAGVTNAGTIAAGGNLSITAAGLDSTNLSAGGGIVGDIAGGITLRGTTSAQGAAGIGLSARGGDLVVAGGARVDTLGTTRLSAAGALTNAGAIAAGTLGGGGPDGSILLSSGGALISTGAIVSNNGAVTLNGASITLGGAINQSGGAYAAGMLGLNAGSMTLLSGAQAIGNAGVTVSGGTLTLGSASLLQANRNIGVDLASTYVSAGDLVALGDLSLGVSGGTIVNQGGAGIFAGGSGAAAGGGSVTLRADGITNAGTIVATVSAGGVGGSATLNAGGITNAGLLHADRTLGVTAGSVTISGIAEAGNAIAWSIPTLVVANGGTLKSANGITLSGANFANAGMVAAGGDLFITASGDLTSSGTLTTSGALQLASGSMLTLAGGSQTIAGSAQATPAIGGGNVALRGANVQSLGTLSATGSLGITADGVTIGGATVANGDLTLTSYSGAAPALTVNAGATLGTYLGDARLGSLSTLDLAGSITASTGSVRFSAGATSIDASGRLAAGRDVAITTTGGGALTVDGQLLAGNDLTLSGGTLAIRAGGTAQAGRDLVFDSSDALNGSGGIGINGTGYDFSGTPISAQLAGKISAGHDLRLSMAGALVADGSAQIIAGNDMTLAAGHLLIGAQFTRDGAGNPVRLGVIAGHDLLLRNRDDLSPGGLGARGLMLDGSIQAGNNLTVQASGEVVSTAAAQLVAGNALAVSGSALNLSGFNSGQNQVAFTAAGASPAGMAARLAAGDVTLGGATASNGRVVLSANTATINAAGSITVRGGAGNATGVGRDIGASANLDIETNGSFTNQGSLWSDGVVFLKSAGGNIVNDARGANGGITAATIVSETDAGAFVNSAGAFKGDNVGLFLGGDFTNTGSFAPSGNYWISAANISNSGLLATSGSLTLQAAGSLYNVGTIYSGSRLTLAAGGALTNDYVGDDQGNGSHGLILAQSDIAITAHDVANQSATIQSLGGGVQFNLTGGGFVNGVKKLSITGSSSAGGTSFIDRSTGASLSSESFYAYSPDKRKVLVEDNVGIVITTDPDPTDANSATKCLRNDDYLSGFAGCVSAGRYASSIRYSVYDLRTGSTNSSVVSALTGSSGVYAAGSIAIDAGSGSVTNSNSSINAGGDVRITTAGSVTNVSDLLVTGGVNTSIVAAPTIIRAGGTVTISAGAFKNVANNLVGADNYTANQVAQHATGAAPSAGSPGTASVGNGASATAVNAGGAVVSGPSSGGASAVGVGSAAGIIGQGRGSVASGAAGTGGTVRVSLASAERASGSGVGGPAGASAVGTASVGSVSGTSVHGVQVVGRVRDAADGAAATALADTTIAGEFLGSPGAASLSAVGAVSGNAGGTVSAALQGKRAVDTDAVAGYAGTSFSDLPQGSGLVLPGGIGAGGGVSPALPGMSTPVPGAGSAGASAGTVTPLPSASTIVPGLVTGLNNVGAPTLANQAFGTFLGGFLASFNLTGNAPSLFTYSANPNSTYLFSSNAALASEAALYDSKWFFDRVSPDRATTYTRLGDGFFEAMLVSREVQAKSGQAQLSEFGSALEQYQGLLKNAEKAQAGLGLQLGVGLTPEQVAALTEPMVWYVRSNVEGREVLVPVVYLAASDAKAIAGGALVAGKNVAITASGNIENSGTIQAKDIVALAAQGGDLVNATGGTIAGGSVLAGAGRDILLAGGSTIRADTGATLQAGRDIVTATISSTSQSATSAFQDSRHWSNSRTVTEQLAGASIMAGGALQLQAGGDLSLNAATLSAGGAAQLMAGGALSLGGTSATTTTTQSERTGKYTNASSTTTSTAFVGTSVTAAGPVTLAAGAALTITGSSVTTTDKATGDITLYGGQGIAIVSAEETATLDQRAQTGKKSTTTTSATSTTNQLSTIDAAGGLTLATPGVVKIEGATVNAAGALAADIGSLTLSGVIDTVDARIDTVSKKSGLLSSTTKRTSTTTHDETAVASTLSGDTGVLTASGAVTITGANLVAANGLTLTAGGPVTIGTLATTDTEQSSSSIKKSGFSLGGGGLFLGVAKTSTTGSTTDVTQSGSVVGTKAGDLTIETSGALGINGSTVAAGGDVLLKGASVSIANALDVRDTTQTTKTSSVGVTIGVQSQLLQSVGNLASMAQLATSTGNDRVAAVAGLAGGMAAVNAYQAGEDLAAAWKKSEGGLGISVGATFGISKSSSTNTTHDETVVGSAVTGRDVTIVANGTGAGGTIDVRGSTVDAKGDLTLAANGAITLAAATEEDRQSGTARSSGFTLGVTSEITLNKSSEGLRSLDKLSPTISVGLSASNSNYTGTQVTNIESVLTAGGT